VTNITNYF